MSPICLQISLQVLPAFRRAATWRPSAAILRPPSRLPFARGLSRPALINALLNQHAWGYVCEGLDQHKLVLPGRGIRKDAACITADQVRNILGIVENPWRLMFACAALLGLRAGEILGLRVEDVDLQNRTLNVSQGAWRGKLQTTKNTASENARPIPLPLDRFFREYLKTWKLNPLGLLFCNRNGRAYTSQKVVEYHLWPLLDALNIKRAGFLHAHATLLLQGGASPKVAQRQLRPVENTVG